MSSGCPSRPRDHQVPVRASRSDAPAPRWVVALAIFGTLWGCLYARHAGAFHGRVLAFGEEPRIAVHLARGDGFRSPFDDSPTAPPTSWSPPVYPALMGATYRALGVDSHKALAALAVLNAACFGLTAAALLVIGSWLVNRPTGALAAALLLAHPIFLARVVYFWDAYVALATFSWALAWSLWQDHRPRPAGPVGLAALGGVLGLLSLTNSAYVLTYPVLFLLATRRQPPARRAALAAAAVAGFALVLAPWTVRNYHAFGRLFFVRAGAPVELWIGNSTNSSGITEDVVDIHPYLNTPERLKVLAWGEIAYFDECLRRFTAERRLHPGHFAAMCARRAGFLLLYDPARDLDPALAPHLSLRRGYPVSVALNDAVALLGFAGCYVAWRLGYRQVVLIVALGLLSVAAYVPTHVDVRYAMPLKAALLLPAALLLSTTFTRVRTGRWPNRS